MKFFFTNSKYFPFNLDFISILKGEDKFYCIIVMNGRERVPPSITLAREWGQVHNYTKDQGKHQTAPK